MFELENLLLAYFDGHTGFYSIEEDESWNNSDHVIKIYFNDRDYFNDFTSFLHGNWHSWHEDDHNIFDLQPFLIDIGYSDMIIILENNITNYWHKL